MGDYVKNGIDISWCQTEVDWNRVDAEFVIIQIGGGYIANRKDAMFDSHYEGAKQRGIPVGGYWFTHAMNEQQARAEADTCIELMKGRKFEYPIYLDLEKEAQFNLGKAKVSAIIRAWLERVEAAGYWVGLYGNLNSLYTFTEDDIEERYAVWLAQWDVARPTYNRAYGIWQYTVGRANGISGACDLDKAYVDYPALIKKRGLNGFGSESDIPEEIRVTAEVNGVKYAGMIGRI